MKTHPGRTRDKQLALLWNKAGLNTVLPEDGREILHRIICGHRIKTIGEIIRSLNQQVIYLDNGAFTNQQPANGNLIALNLETMKLTMQPWIDRKAEW